MELRCRCSRLGGVRDIPGVLQEILQTVRKRRLVLASYCMRYSSLVVKLFQVRRVGAGLRDMVDGVVVIGIDRDVAVDMRAELKGLQRLMVMTPEFLQLREARLSPRAGRNPSGNRAALRRPTQDLAFAGVARDHRDFVVIDDGLAAADHFLQIIAHVGDGEICDVELLDVDRDDVNVFFQTN